MEGSNRRQERGNISGEEEDKMGTKAANLKKKERAVKKWRVLQGPGWLAEKPPVTSFVVPADDDDEESDEDEEESDDDDETDVGKTQEKAGPSWSKKDWETFFKPRSTK